MEWVKCKMGNRVGKVQDGYEGVHGGFGNGKRNVEERELEYVDSL